MSRWGSAPLLVRKQNGEWRLCGDYRRVNAVTLVEPYPMQRTDWIFAQVGAKTKVISSMDLSCGYY